MPELSEGAREVLEDAYRILQTEGWIQGARYSPGYGRCVLGALDYGSREYANRHHHHLGIHFSFDEMNVQQAVVNEAIQVICQYTGGFDIAMWNDAPHRTFRDVVNVLYMALHNGDSSDQVDVTIVAEPGDHPSQANVLNNAAMVAYYPEKVVVEAQRQVFMQEDKQKVLVDA